MSVEYAEIVTSEDIRECVTLQKIIFNLSDIDVIPEMFLKMIARKDPLMGFLVGVYKIDADQKHLIGFHISVATYENHSIYSVITGVLPEYQNKMYGYGLILKAREIAIQDDIKTVYTLFDPLESNLGRLYMQKFGFKGVRFKENAYEINTPHLQSNDIPNDKILVKWDLLCDETLRKIEGKFSQISLSDALQKYPVVTNFNLVDHQFVLVEIPNDFKLMKKTEYTKAMDWRKSIQIIFSEYINKNNYIISDCLSSRIEKIRKTFYLLEKI